MNIKKTLISGIAIAGLLATTTLPAFAANDKVTIFDNFTGSCATGATSGTEVGFANLRIKDGAVSGETAVKGAQPNTTYNLFVFDQDCNSQLVGTLSTNGQGNWNAHFDQINIPGATGYFVGLQDLVTGDTLASQITQ